MNNSTSYGDNREQERTWFLNLHGKNGVIYKTVINTHYMAIEYILLLYYYLPTVQRHNDYEHLIWYDKKKMDMTYKVWGTLKPGAFAVYMNSHAQLDIDVIFNSFFIFPKLWFIASLFIRQTFPRRFLDLSCPFL